MSGYISCAVPVANVAIAKSISRALDPDIGGEFGFAQISNQHLPDISRSTKKMR